MSHFQPLKSCNAAALMARPALQNRKDGAETRALGCGTAGGVLNRKG